MPEIFQRLNNEQKILGIKHYYQGQQDKKQAFNQLLTKLNLNTNEVAYMGDDVIDLSVMTHVGLAIAVNNAVDAIKPYANFITKKSGGHGAVREVCDFLLKSPRLRKRIFSSVS